MRIVVDKNLMVPMRDGLPLATDVYRPDGPGPFPTLVQRLPYNKEVGPLVNFSFDVLRGVQAGYAVAVQDTRGRWASGGEFNPSFDEARDGANTIAWAAAQPWSTGAVGMIGGSYIGATQWTAATQTPGALRAIAPFVTTDQYYDGWAYQGGAFQLGFSLHWTLLSLASGEVVRRMGAGAASAQDFAALVAAVDGNEALYRRLPLLGLPEVKGLAPYYDDWLSHPSCRPTSARTTPRRCSGLPSTPAPTAASPSDAASAQPASKPGSGTTTTRCSCTSPRAVRSRIPQSRGNDLLLKKTHLNRRWTSLGVALCRI